MKRCRFTDEQIVAIVKEGEAGRVADVCRPTALPPRPASLEGQVGRARAQGRSTTAATRGREARLPRSGSASPSAPPQAVDARRTTAAVGAAGRR